MEDDALADLDEALRRLLADELGVAVTFDPPARRWTGEQPALSLFLYDVREPAGQRSRQWTTEREGDTAHRVAPPLRLAATYALAAWAADVMQEHALLSRALAVLHSNPVLPGEARIGPAPAHDEAPSRDLWSSLGGQSKLAVAVRAVVSLPARPRPPRGPAVREPQLRVVEAGGVPELHSAQGTVRHADGTPAADAWLVAPDAGVATATGPDGGFEFERLPAGRHRVLVRGAAGERAEGVLVVPGDPGELTLG
jgi:hypothetical protein